jgi:tricorn protease
LGNCKSFSSNAAFRSLVMRSLLLMLCLFSSQIAFAQPSTQGYYRYPTLHKDTIVFTAQGDLWRVSAKGGIAQALTTHAGMESNPAISPNGTQVAFTATYEGPSEVYVMPLEGGTPTRLTYHGETANVVGWTPNGKVLYTTRALSTLPNYQLCTIDPRTRKQTRVPLAQASEGGYDTTGKTLFFTRFSFQGSPAKRYKGGRVQQIWRFAEGDKEAIPLCKDYAGTSKQPMYWNGRVFFLTDRDGDMNLWSMNPNGGDLKQHTKHRDWDIQSASLDSGRIVYQLGADLWLYDIATNKDTLLPVAISSDIDQLREKWVKDPLEYLSYISLSPDGERVALTARGRAFVAPVGPGRFVEATRLNGIRYRSATFAADGKSLYATSDASGETEWVRIPADGLGEITPITKGSTVLAMSGRLSPDGKNLAYADKNYDLWLISTADGKREKIASGEYGAPNELAWSPDSQWLAYVLPTQTFDRIWIYSPLTKKTTPVTTDRADSFSPAWSPEGKWLYFLSDRTFNSRVGSPWGNRHAEPFFDKQTKIYALSLTKGARFPFTPTNELPAPKGGEVTLSGVEKRLFEVPIPAGNYSRLSVSKTRLFYEAFTPETRTTLLALDITSERPTPKPLASNVQSYELSRNGEKLLVRTGNELTVVSSNAGGAGDGRKADLSGWAFSIIPREEWRQLFKDAWRLHRDYFYDRNMHGVDWNAVLKKHLPLVERVRDRAELNNLLAMMVSELSALHTYVFGGDMRAGNDDILPAGLGAELIRDEAKGGYRIAHIYQGEPDYPNTLSPLSHPEIEAQEGDIITHINGESVLGFADIGEPLRNKAGKQVRLHIKEGATGRERDCIIVPQSLAKERDLRYLDWETSRRKKVDEEGQNTIGYVHLRAMGAGDIAQWAKEFYPVFARQGLIVDVRHNGGGNIDSWILNRLLRRAWFYWQPRIGKPYWNMQGAFRGHVVVLCDEATGSDGEAFTEGVRRLGIGKIIGTRTWGGEIWLSGSNTLLDDGLSASPEFGVYADGKWLIEGHGVDPDITVDNLPHSAFKGADSQLDAAIAYLKRRIQEKPNPVPPAPAYPNKSFRKP